MKTVEIAGIRVQIQRKKVKRVRLKISIEGEAILVLPLTVSEQYGVDFARSKAAWLQAQIERKKDLPVFEALPRDGESFSLFGKNLVCRVTAARVPRFEATETELLCALSEDGAKNARAYRKWKQDVLTPVLTEYLAKWSASLRVTHGKIKLRLMRTQWGSCNVKTRDISFNLRLLAQPLASVEAVVLHELCHILHTGHGAAFYRPVLTRMPDYKARIKQLKMF